MKRISSAREQKVAGSVFVLDRNKGSNQHRAENTNVSKCSRHWEGRSKDRSDAGRQGPQEKGRPGELRR